MKQDTLKIGKSYNIESRLGVSGKYTLYAIHPEKTKQHDVMYLFKDTSGNKVGFINRLYLPKGIEISEIKEADAFIPSAPPLPSLMMKKPLHILPGKPSENRDFWDKDEAPITPSSPFISNTNSLTQSNPFGSLDEDLYG